MLQGERELSPQDREFFRLVQEAIYANPFGGERQELDRKISGQGRGGRDSGSLESLIARVADRLAVLIPPGQGRMKKYVAGDRELLRYGALFSVFHLFCNWFDQLIEKQIAAGPESLPVSFAGEAIGMLVNYGLSREQALQSFSFFFQMRRAFYFISRIVGRSSSMQQLRCNLWNNIFTRDINLYERYLWNRMEDFSTLLLGETGTGKTLAAAAIGRSGHIPFNEKKKCFEESFTTAFVAINLSQFPEQLVESELFGHKKGAFTGAMADHQGVFARCSRHGAIFLDEIGEVSIPVQIKLLQVLQERMFSPVGGHERRRFSGRTIAATNRSVGALRTAGSFREDFFYRLCTDVIDVPPLRQRIREAPGELEDLLVITMTRIIGRPSPELVDMALDKIGQQLPSDYPWPGNVRELEQCARRLLVTGSYQGEKSAIMKIGQEEVNSQLIGQEELTAVQLISKYCRILYNRYQTYEAVAKRTGLDRRTVRKYVVMGE